MNRFCFVSRSVVLVAVALVLAALGVNLAYAQSYQPSWTFENGPWVAPATNKSDFAIGYNGSQRTVLLQRPRRPSSLLVTNVKEALSNVLMHPAATR